MSPSKRCTKCLEVKEMACFRRIRNLKGEWVHHSWCNACKNEQSRLSRRGQKAEDGRKVRRIAKFGQGVHTAKLADEDVQLIRQLEPPRYHEAADEVAKKFEVSRSTVLKIWKGRTWTHV